MKITKEMFKRCLNEDMVIFAKLPDDVREILRVVDREYLRNGLVWVPSISSDVFDTAVYRINPNTEVTPDIEEIPVTFSKRTDGIYGCVPPGGTKGWRGLSTCICHVRFRGIVYTKDGKEHVCQDINRNNGIPMRVLFEKD